MGLNMNLKMKTNIDNQHGHVHGHGRKHGHTHGHKQGHGHQNLASHRQDKFEIGFQSQFCQWVAIEPIYGDYNCTMQYGLVLCSGSVLNTNTIG